MPRETDVIQHKVKLTEDTPGRCKPYHLRYAMKEELQNAVDSMLEKGVMRPLTSPDGSPFVIINMKMVLTACVLTLRS